MLPAGGLPEQFALGLGGLQNLRARAAANDPAALRIAAQQFEALLLHNMLKQMRQASWQTEGDAFAPSDSMQLYWDFFDQLLAQRMAQGKGLGFAEQITAQINRTLGHHTPDAATVPAALQRVQPAEARAEVNASAQSRSTEIQTGPLHSVTSGERTDTASPRARFLSRMRPYAEMASKRTGVPADLILAHAALESGWGQREIRFPDGRPSHNLFGIKASSQWPGAAVEVLTTEYRHGVPIKLYERFRAYGDYAEAFADYANLLLRRYLAGMSTPVDAQTFVTALVAGGYATDPSYAFKLRSVIASIARNEA